MGLITEQRPSSLTTRTNLALFTALTVYGCSEVQTANLRGNVIENGELMPVVYEDLTDEDRDVECGSATCAFEEGDITSHKGAG